MRVLAIRHVHVEHLGLLEPILKDMGFELDYMDTAQGERLKRSLEDYSLIVVLGGYMGAYEEYLYPFLSYEFRLIEEALKLDVPLIGICLGSQMLAKVLGAKVYRGEKGKEIGWFEVYKRNDHIYFEEFPQRLKVFQWHGDTFDLPSGAVRVYSSEKYENQAFVYKRAVGLQFHIEVDKNMIKDWMKIYKDELEKEGINPKELLSCEGAENKNLLDIFLRRFLYTV
ncbi:MAG: gamma-glutamyl-gamma-aminobutyrate hydrolase family protein [Hydrogenobacter sp.]|uniref:type 1 glutamine amidotransferase n=1 Tax=Hydrogenobacter thermophilus TaxID=940 RepID=UPI0030F538D7